MKKIKNIFAVALIALTGFISLVAMKPMREKFPELGIFNGEPPVIEPCVGCPGQTAYTIQNNSKCSTYLKFVLGFEAQQGAINTNEFIFQYLQPVPTGTINILNSDINTIVSGMGIDINQPYILPKGGIDIYYNDPSSGINTVIGNVKPGESKTIQYVPGSTKLCECYKVNWNESTKTITIDDCK